MTLFDETVGDMMNESILGRAQERGHIAIRTTDTERAMAYLREKGIGFDESTAGRGDDGRVRVIYFDRDIAGFRFHLAQK